MSKALCSTSAMLFTLLVFAGGAQAAPVEVHALSRIDTDGQPVVVQADPKCRYYGQLKGDAVRFEQKVCRQDDGSSISEPSTAYARVKLPAKEGTKLLLGECEPGVVGVSADGSLRVCMSSDSSWTKAAGAEKTDEGKAQ